MPGARLWRRLRRRAAMELDATWDALREKPYSVRPAYRLARTALRFRIYPSDALLYELDRNPAADARDYLVKRSHTILQNRLNPPTHHHLVLNKLDYHLACLARGVAAPPVLAVVDFGPDVGRCARLDAIRIETAAQMAAFLISLPKATRIIFKSLSGTYAHGLLGLTVDGEGGVDAEGRYFGPAAILEHCEARRKEGGFLVQPWLEPHPGLRPLMPGPALGTVRVVTVLVGNDVLVPFACLKIPVGRIIYDLFNHGRTGNLLALVDVADGRIGPAWGASRTRRRRLDVCPAHPDSGVALAGFQIPQWPEVLRTVTEGARAFTELRTLGWDVAVTSKGIFLLEGNHHWDPEGLQLLLRRGFRPDMEALVAKACG